MRRRGPAGSGLWQPGEISLGHCRLKLIDLSEAASQPVVDPHVGLAVAFNGCIYNHRELRRELEAKGRRFFTGHDGGDGSDTEVILHAYAEWGDSFVERLHGMFRSEERRVGEEGVSTGSTRWWP